MPFDHARPSDGTPRFYATSDAASATLRMGVAMVGLVSQWMRGLTINSHERLAIAHLWEHGPMTMSELGARIPLSRAAVTALTDRLEGLGYVVRTPDEHDRRRTMLSLTPRPAALVASMVAEWGSAVADIEAGFTADELRAIERYADQLRTVSHAFATPLRARSDDELPQAEPAQA